MSSVIGKELFLNAPIGIASVSREGLITQVNPKLCEMLCYDHDELLGKSILDIMHPNDGVHGKQSLIHFKKYLSVHITQQIIYFIEFGILINLLIRILS